MEFNVIALAVGILIGGLAALVPMLIINKKTLDKAEQLVYQATNEGWTLGFDQGQDLSLSDFEVVKKAYYTMLAEDLDSAIEAGTF